MFHRNCTPSHSCSFCKCRHDELPYMYIADVSRCILHGWKPCLHVIGLRSMHSYCFIDCSNPHTWTWFTRYIKDTSGVYQKDWRMFRVLFGRDASYSICKSALHALCVHIACFAKLIMCKFMDFISPNDKSCNIIDTTYNIVAYMFYLSCVSAWNVDGRPTWENWVTTAVS